MSIAQRLAHVLATPGLFAEMPKRGCGGTAPDTIRIDLCTTAQGPRLKMHTVPTVSSHQALAEATLFARVTHTLLPLLDTWAAQAPILWATHPRARMRGVARFPKLSIFADADGITGINLFGASVNETLDGYTIYHDFIINTTQSPCPETALAKWLDWVMAFTGPFSLYRLDDTSEGEALVFASSPEQVLLWGLGPARALAHPL